MPKFKVCVFLQKLQNGWQYLQIKEQYIFSKSKKTNENNNNNKEKDSKKPAPSKVEENNNDSKENEPDVADNTKSAFGVLKGVLPKYFSSEWSIAQFRVPDVRTIVAFTCDETSIIVVSADGTFYKASFDSHNGGDCIKQVEESFLKPRDDA